MESKSKEELLERLSALRPSQEHVLTFWDRLDPAARRRLVEQFAAIDLEVVAEMLSDYSNTSAEPKAKWADLAARAEPPTAFRLDGSGERFSQNEAKQRGEDALRAGKLGMILVAGGQGSRLGFDAPKGMFPLGPISKRTLFQIIIERLLAMSRRYGTVIPLYLMTSPATHEETVKFLNRHDRFGLTERDLHIFCQGVLPAIDAQSGKFLLRTTDSLALAPDGHGGMLAALVGSGCLSEARARGVEHFFYGQVDNPLLQVCDPLLIGYHLLSESDLTTQVVRKTGPQEKVGNVVSIDGRVQIIEYSDLPDEQARQTNPDGSLRLWAGNIAVHVFRLEFLSNSAQHLDSLPFHRAKKVVPFVNVETGQRVVPEAPNAIKFERFIFDLLPLAKNGIVVESDRAKAFAPVKNSNDHPADTPNTAQSQMIAADTAMLQAAGANVQDGTPVEINPMFALDADVLAKKIQPGLSITEPTYLN